MAAASSFAVASLPAAEGEAAEEAKEVVEEEAEDEAEEEEEEPKEISLVLVIFLQVASERTFSTASGSSRITSLRR